MKNKKGFTQNTRLFKRAALFLEEKIKTDKRRMHVPVDLIRFIDEAKEFEENGVKTYSPDRAVKLYGIITSFLNIYDIDCNEDLAAVLDGFKKSTKSNAATSFIDAINEVRVLVKNLPLRDIDGVKLYFIDGEEKERLVTIKEKLEQVKKNMVEKKIYAFRRVINFINPDAISHRYKIVFNGKYQYISKIESILKYLPKHHAIVVNKLNKMHSDLLKTHQFSDATKAHIEIEHKVELKRIENEYAYIMQRLQENPESFDVKILSYDHLEIYPEIRYSAANRTRYAHLRSEVENILWYTPNQLQKDMKASQIASEYNHAFGDVYYMEKTDEKKKN